MVTLRIFWRATNYLITVNYLITRYFSSSESPEGDSDASPIFITPIVNASLFLLSVL